MKYIICILLTISICNAQSVETLIRNSDIKYKNIAISICKVESNLGKSKLAKTKHNIYGFKSGKYYKSYKNKEHSIQDYLKFETRIIKKYNIINSKHYLITISKFYAEDKINWLNKIKKYEKI